MSQRAVSAFSPKIRAAVASRAGDYAKQLSAATGNQVDASLQKLAQEGDFAALRKRLHETKPSLDSQIAHFNKHAPPVADALRQLNNSLNDLHSLNDSFWKDKTRDRPIDFSLFRENIMTRDIVDRVEKQYEHIQQNPEDVIKKALTIESFVGELDAQLSEALKEGVAVQKEAQAQIADVDEQVKVVEAERDNLLYTVVEEELAKDPEFSAELDRAIIEHNWDPEPEQEQASPATGQNLPW